MNSLAGYIATFLVAIAVAYFSQFLLPNVRLRYWMPLNFLYIIPANQLGPQAAPAPAQPSPAIPFQLLTHSITVQNFGRKSADRVEIVHRRRPDFFQFYPSLNYQEVTTPAGEHILRIDSLAPKEWFTIQFLSYLNRPELLYIRSAAGQASLMPWMYVRRYPRWVIHSLSMLTLIGSGFCAYWVIRAAVFLFKLMHVQ